jgi:hypothetical protein
MYAEYDMDMALTEYADHLKADYISWSNSLNFGKYDVTFDRGKKFIKVVKNDGIGGRSVHSFVCIKAHDKWQVGDILKAASWAAPAKNFVRGNVLRKEYKNARWTGI